MFRRQSTLGTALLASSIALGCTSTSDPDEETSSGDTEGSSDTDASGTDSTGDIDPEPIDPADPDEPLNPELYDGGEYWRIDLQSEVASGVVTVGNVSFVAVPAGQHDPVPVIGGDYLAVAYANDEVRAAVPLYFPGAGRVEYELEGGGMVLEVVEHATAPATVFVPVSDDVTRVEILDESGGVAAEVAADNLPTMSFRSTNNPVSAAFPGIEVILPGEEARIPPEYYMGGHVETVVEPTTAQYQMVIDELTVAPPALVASIASIIIANPVNGGCKGADIPCGYNDDGSIKVAQWCADNGLGAMGGEGTPIPTSFLGGAAIGSFMVLNVNAAPWSSGTVLHEGGHNFNNRLDKKANVDHTTAWPAAAVTEARKLADNYRLAETFSQTWTDIHNKAAEWDPAGTIRPWDGGAWCSLGEAEVVPWGFATPYGSSNVADDIAEYVAKPIKQGASALVCAQFAGRAGGDFPKELVLPYTKLSLLHQLGALTRAQFDACVQGVSPSRSSQGIELNDQVFTSELKAGYYESGDTRYFAILGQGVGDWQLLYEVAVPEGKSPLGVHQFGNFSLFNLGFTPQNGVYLNHPETPRASDSGILVITEASTERVTGAVFNLILQNAFAVDTSHTQYASFLIGSPP